MDNSPFHIPPVPAKLIIIASVWIGFTISAMSWLFIDIARGLLIIVLVPMAVLLLLYGYYIVIYIFSRIYWYLLAISAAWIVVILAGITFMAGFPYWILGAAMLGISALLWRVLDHWLPSSQERAVRFTLEEQETARQRRRAQHPLNDPSPEHPTRPRRPAPPPERPDPDRINKEIAARKQRLNP